MAERHVEINAGSLLQTVTFSANGEFLMSGDFEGVRVWRVEDGEEMATMKVSRVSCAALSKDGRWIAAGTYTGEVYVWNAGTLKQALKHEDVTEIYGVDFSPDSSRLVVASESGTASVWDVAPPRRVSLLRHGAPVIAAKYSPLGDKVATATRDSLRVYDSRDGRLLMHIEATVDPVYLWFNNRHLLVVSDNKIKQIEASTGSTVSEWPVPVGDEHSCIALLKQGQFIAYSTKHTITFWKISIDDQLSLAQHYQDISAVALSPKQFLAVGRQDGKIVIESLSRIEASTREQEKQNELLSTSGGDDNDPLDSTPSSPPSIADSTLLSPLHYSFQAPDLHIDDATLDFWKQDQLTNAEALLTVEITPQNPNHHMLASRALVRARMQKWDTAHVDAEKAIEIQPTISGYIAKSIALVGKGERHKGYRTCDIAFARFHSSHSTFLLLIKAIVAFVAGEHGDAISRVEDLIATVNSNSICYMVQAYMFLLLGNWHMECSDYEGAIESFEHARAQMRHHESQLLLIISLIFGWKFDNIITTVWQRLCDALDAAGRTRDAAECFNQMTSELGGETKLRGSCLEWALDFRQRSSEKLKRIGDTAVDAQQYDEAISHYTIALSLKPRSPQRIHLKRSRAYLATGSYKQALDDADEVIRLDPSSPWGYEIKHAALHKAGEYDNAINALEAMPSKMVQSPDSDAHRHGDLYISPSTTQATIRKIVQRTIRDFPRVLINTTTGRLHNKAEQAYAFESLPIFNELVSLTTTRIDYVRIKHEVQQYFRYVMLSHKLEDNEPVFEKVIHVAVYDLERFPTHDKLQTFCKIVRDAGFNWAWSNTCCIDRSDHFVLQEALVAMFEWYQGCAMMIVFLRGVRSSSQIGALVESIWNTRAWTLQEYIAAKVVHFYTEDWTPYLNVKPLNHKESPEVISEMEQATGLSAEQFMALRPGLTSIREKLRLASTREATLVEDAAYSLFGIFSVTSLETIYGEGDRSLGRLLAHILTGSGDESILAWTGRAGSFNSCLPAYITVFKGQATTHLPTAVPEAEMEKIITASHASSFDLDVALSLYDCLSELPAPWFAASRMKLPCIAFQLPPLSPYHHTHSGRIYRVDTPAFGTVEITSTHDLSRTESLYLVHPWLDSLLEQDNMRSGAFIEDDVVPPPTPPTDGEEIPDDELEDPLLFPEPELPSHATSKHIVSMDRDTLARRLVARLRQPFGALLLTSASGGRAVDYRRIAADCLITVQFQENVSLSDILDNVRTLDVL